MESSLRTCLALMLGDSWIGRNWAAVAIALTLVSLGVFVALVLARYVRICLRIFCDTPPPLSMGPTDFQRLVGEPVCFRSFDGTSLRGMMLRTPNRRDRKGTIVFCHEYGSDMYSCARYARPLIEAGFDMFTFDFRGHGESSNWGKYRPLQWPSDKEMEDVLGACAYVEASLAAEGSSPHVGVFGISRGAGAALLAASSDLNIKAIICDGAFSTEATLISLMKRWASIFARVKLVYENHPDAFWRFLHWLLMRFAQPKMGCRYLSVRKALEEMQSRPIFFIHGQRDSYIRLEQTQLLYDAAPSPKYIWIVPAAKHNQSVIVEPRQYASRTIAFFRKHLAGENVPESAITSAADAEVA
ncbi:MAG: alpha/beta fold hydrolase [Planctomycetes bacterium]|nr:alpha/beta fold hydrolase [Planctomycetota bacterium]